MFILRLIKCTIALCLKKVHTLIEHTLFLKIANHHLSLQQVNHCAGGGLASMSMAAD